MPSWHSTLLSSRMTLPTLPSDKENASIYIRLIGIDSLAFNYFESWKGYSQIQFSLTVVVAM
jgi:hypothetical protein